MSTWRRESGRFFVIPSQSRPKMISLGGEVVCSAARIIFATKLLACSEEIRTTLDGN
jgi:hypothetical protein